jgi:hypothetical protein
MIKTYPDFSEITPDLRGILHPFFKSLHEGVSEFTFANLYLFRETHSYRISRLNGDMFVVAGMDEVAGSDEVIRSDEVAGPHEVTGAPEATGSDAVPGTGEVTVPNDITGTVKVPGDRWSGSFFMLPFGLPEGELLDELFDHFYSMKAVTETQAGALSEMGYSVAEDRDNFDYLYLKTDLESLRGRKYHRKKNLVNAFINNQSYEGKPLLEEYHGDALEVLESWKEECKTEGDYDQAKEAVEKAEELSLCGGIYYVDKRPAAFTLGEEIAGGNTFVIHFEKAVTAYKGIYQFINMSFASILPEKYVYVNREQDLGDPGLRQSKMSYKPHAFIKKYRAFSE